MPRFMFLQRGGCEGQPEMTPEAREARMKSCMEWMQGGTEEGWLLTVGDVEGRILADGDADGQT